MLGYYCLWTALVLGSSAACKQPGTSWSSSNRLCKGILASWTWTCEFPRNCFTLLKSTLLLLLSPTWLKHLFVCLSMQSHPRNTLSCGESPGRWLRDCPPWVGNSLLFQKATWTPTRIMSKSVQDHRSMHCTQPSRTETLAVEQPAQSAKRQSN